MAVELLISFLSLALSALAGGVASTEVVRKLVYKFLRKPLPQPTYAERLANLTAGLSKASREVDSVLQEMALVARERETSATRMEGVLLELEKRERDLQKRIDILQTVPIPVAEQFAKLVEPSERRSARRDYILFLAGVVATTKIAILLQVGLGQ